MKIIFWAVLFIILYVYLIYPLIILILSVFIRRKIQTKDIEPKLTFLISAYNEEKNIREKIENTLSLDYPKDKLEVIVASDASSDKTDDIVKEYADKGVRLFRVEGRLGKTEVQNRAVDIADGEVIIFSDSTTHYENSAIRKIVRNYADPKVGAVSGRYKYFDPNSSQIGSGTIAFWDYENFIKMRQTRIRTVTGCCGCIYSVRRSAYMKLPGDIISDLVEPLKVLGQGYRIVFEPEAIAYEATCQKSSEEFKMRVRVISRGMRGILYMKKLLNPIRYPFVAFQLASHKVLRWLVPLFLIVLYSSNCLLLKEGIFYQAFLWLQSFFYFFALVGFLADSLPKKIKLFSLPLYFCVVNLASLIALIRTLLRKKDIVWNTVR